MSRERGWHRIGRTVETHARKFNHLGRNVGAALLCGVVRTRCAFIDRNDKSDVVDAQGCTAATITIVAGSRRSRDGSAMRMILVEVNPTTFARPLQRQMEKTSVEVFLDFDPVFPGWPPEELLVEATREPQKVDRSGRQHRDDDAKSRPTSA